MTLSIPIFASFAVAAIGLALPVQEAFGANSPAVTKPVATSTSAADHLTVELVSETSTLRPGSRAWLGLKFTHEPHWHTYWMNPGDSGLPTRLEWRLPRGFRAGEIAWPAPKRFDVGDLFNFGYDNTVLLMVPIDVPADVPQDAPATAALSVNVRWLICNDVCIPGKAALRIDVPVMQQPGANQTTLLNASTAALFAKSRAAQPVVVATRGTVNESSERIRIELAVDKLPTDGVFDIFPTSAKLFTNAPFKFTRSGNQLIVSGVRSEYFENAPATLSLVITRRTQGSGTLSAWQFEIPWSSVPRTSASK